LIDDCDAASPVRDNESGEVIDTARIPGGGYLSLICYGDDYEIVLDDGEQLMGSWAYRSEEALATLVAERLGRDPEKILIGGLGMGFTLAAARRALPAATAIVVAELIPRIVAWAQGPLAHIVGGSLSDPRVTVTLRDVHDVITDPGAAFDAILLDVDNGPDGLVHLANERLYSPWGLRAARATLRPGGILAIWSAYPDPDFSVRLGSAGFAIEEIDIVDRAARPEARHTIWLARRHD
jgi:spermidine synthase